MDPISVLGGVVTTLQLLGNLSSTLRLVSQLHQGIRDIDENTRHFRQDLDALQFSLTVIDRELRRSDHADAVFEDDWWASGQLDRILHNATATFGRLETIFSDLSRQTPVLPRLRAYYRSRRYDEQISHLRLRVMAYISTLTLPVIVVSR